MQLAMFIFDVYQKTFINKSFLVYIKDKHS